MCSSCSVSTVVYTSWNSLSTRKTIKAIFCWHYISNWCMHNCYFFTLYCGSRNAKLHGSILSNPSTRVIHLFVSIQISQINPILYGSCILFDYINFKFVDSLA